MIRRPPRSTLTDTLCPYTTLFRSTPPTPRIGITRRPSDSWALGSIVHSAIVRSVGGVAPTCGWRGVGGVAPTYGDAMSDGIVPTLPELVALRAAAQGRRPPRRGRHGVSRSEERRVGKECGSTCRSRGSTYH